MLSIHPYSFRKYKLNLSPKYKIVNKCIIMFDKLTNE